MSILIGLEKEFFITKDVYDTDLDGKKTLVSREFASALDAEISDACDECGYLAEVRGEPKDNIISALFSLQEKEFMLRRKIKKEFTLPDISFARIPNKVLQQFNRRYGKGSAHDECMYGEVKEKRFQTAGLHIHFSNFREASFSCDCGKTHKQKFEYQLNMPRIIHALDVYFSYQIACAKRQPGIYEMKPWGFEYRSLPNNINTDLLIDFFTYFKF